MSALKPREKRQPVRIGARLKSGRGWSDIVLRNVSPRGVMGQCPAPPARGDYVEVRCGAYVIVARVVWTGGDKFGARTRDRIELGELIASAQGRERPVEERRVAPRSTEPVLRRPSTGEQAAASVRVGRALDFASVALVGALMAALAAGAAHDALARPLGQVTHALGGEARP